MSWPHLIYDYAVPVTYSDTVDDPAGPFAGLHVDTPGTLSLWPYGGPQANLPIAIAVVAGQTVTFPVRRVGVGNTSATCHGLVSQVVRQGPK